MERAEGKSKNGKYIIVGLAVIAVGVGSYFAYQQYQKKNKQKNNALFEAQIDPTTKPTTTQQSIRPATSQITSGFPLKRGSKGAIVRKMQEALVKHFKIQIGIDGDFGPQTQKAILKAGFSVPVSSSAYEKIITGNKSGAKTTSTSGKAKLSRSEATQLVAKMLKLAVYKGDLNKALKALRYIKSTGAYTRVNNEFKRKPIPGHFTRKRIDQALFGKFTDRGDKAQIETELKRIGLKKSGATWSLSGLSGGELVTVSEAKVWNSEGETILVPSQTILGTYIEGANGVTEFETIDGNRLFVATSSIQYGES